MQSLNHILLTFLKWWKLRLVMMVILSLPFWTTVCFGANVLEEEKLDRAAGILDREWKINLIRLATRDYLRLRSQVKTGLPNYDQLIENTRVAPAALYEQLTSRPVEPASSIPRGASLPPEVVKGLPAVSPSADPGSQEAPAATQGPPSPPTDISTSPTPPSLPLPDLNPPPPSLPPGAPTPTLPPPSGPGPSVIP